MISPLLSNIYLHVLDTVWTRRYAHLGVLVRYADDFVVMCDTKAACEQAEQRVREILARLGLELHPEKTRRVDLSRGRDGLRFSRLPPAQAHERAHLGATTPTGVLPPAMAVSTGDATDSTACEGADARAPCAIGTCAPPSRSSTRCSGAGAPYFRTGNAAVKFGQVDDYVNWRLKRLLVKRHGRHLRAGQAARWTPDFFHALGLHRLRGTIRYPEAA